MKKTNTKPGFTLIELLVVIAIIGLLAGLLFPAVASALNTAKKTKAKSICQNIETAIMVYYNEYNRLPTTATTQPAVGSSNEQFSKDVLKVLMAIPMAPNTNHVLNHKRIVFLESEVPSEEGEYIDPWGTQFQIILDLDANGSITYLNNSGANHRKKAVVVSAGRDRKWGSSTSKDNDNKDNIANVELPLLN